MTERRLLLLAGLAATLAITGCGGPDDEFATDGGKYDTSSEAITTPGSPSNSGLSASNPPSLISQSAANAIAAVTIAAANAAAANAAAEANAAASTSPASSSPDPIPAIGGGDGTPVSDTPGDAPSGARH